MSPGYAEPLCVSQPCPAHSNNRSVIIEVSFPLGTFCKVQISLFLGAEADIIVQEQPKPEQISVLLKQLQS